MISKTASAQSDPNKPAGLDNRPQIEKKVFIHYKKDHVKPENPGGGKNKAPSCYGFLAKGAYWKTPPVNIVIDPDNLDGLHQNFIVQAVNTAFNQWGQYTPSGLVGGYEIVYDADWDGDSPDGSNEIVFDSYPNNGVIAVTVIWGYFSGPIQTREILEFDILFNDYFTWGDAQSNSSLMDVQNIATHELGHGLGLDDIYQTACSDVTMYGYSTEGETKKQTLEPADIAGIQKLYGI